MDLFTIERRKFNLISMSPDTLGCDILDNGIVKVSNDYLKSAVIAG